MVLFNATQNIDNGHVFRKQRYHSTRTSFDCLILDVISSRCFWEGCQGPNFVAADNFDIVQEYFYGLSNDLSPHSSVANFSDLQVFRIGGGPQAPRSALPIGAEPTADPTRVVPVGFSRDLLHVVLAVSFAKDPEHLLSRYS